MTAALLNCGSDILSKIPSVQLKNSLKKNVLYGFGLSMVLILSIFLLTASLIREKKVHPPFNIISDGNTGIVIEFLKELTEVQPLQPLEEIPEVFVPRAGDPVSASENTTATDLSFASTGQLQYSSSRGREIDNFDPSVFAKQGPVSSVDIPVRPVEPQKVLEDQVMQVFEVDKPPYVDVSELSKNTIYPELARKARIEGNVLVRLIVKVDGTPANLEVVHADNKLLVDAAMDAIRKTKFEPAVRNGIKVKCSVMIPVRFILN